MGYYFGDFGNMMGYGFGGGIMIILFWAVIIVFIVWIVKEVGGRNSERNDPKTNSALNILKERYAKGEINKEEFEQKKKDLSN